MELNFKRKQKTLIILIDGEIDHHTAKELRKQTESAMIEMGGKNIIYGFEQVSFMDSSGIGMLIGRYKQLKAYDGKIALVGANEKIIEIIRLSGLLSLLPVFSSVDEALSYTEGRNLDAV